MKPFFSIILPTFNRADRIQKTIASVQSQTFSDWELIVVDDGSTDNTREIIESYNDARIVYLSKENGERGAARNYGVLNAQGEFINFFDSDDLMHPWHLQTAKQHLDADNSISCLCFSYDYYSYEGKYLGTRKGFEKDLNSKILEYSFIHLNGSFIREELCKKYQFENDRNFHISEDWYFFVQLSFHTKLFGFDKPTTMYVLHEGSTMSNMKPNDFLVATIYFEELLNLQKANYKIKQSIFGELYSMTSLAYALNKKRRKSFNYLRKSISEKPSLLFSRRFLGILKNMIYVA